MELHREKIEIVPVDFKDIQSVCCIESECFSEPWSHNSFKQELINNKSFFKVAKVNLNVVGYILMQCMCGEGYITNLAVVSEFRRLGIGSTLLEDCILYAEKNKFNLISLEVRASNNNAIKLYRSKNFEFIGIRKNFYRKPTEDACIMTRYF